MATPIEWLNEFQVTTGAAAGSGNQDPHIIGLSNGNFLVAWTEPSTTGVGTDTGDDIIGKIYDAEGNVVRDSYQLNAGFFLDDEGDFDIAATNDGGFVMVYVDDDISNPNETAIIWQRFNSTGDPIDSATIASENVAVDILGNPQVAVDQLTNTSIVTYTDDVGVDTDISAVTVSAVGTVSAEFTAAQNSAEADRDGDVAILTNGNIVSVYEELDGGTTGVEFLIRTQAGGPVTGATNISSGANIDPQVAALSGGGFIVVWQATDIQNGNIEFQIFDNSGASVIGPLSLAIGTNLQNEPEVVALPDGDAVVIWDDDTSGDLFGRRINPNGTLDGSQITIENVATTSPNIGATSDGRILFTWDEEGGEIMSSIWDPRPSTINVSDYQTNLPNFVDTTVITSNITSSTVNGNGLNNTILGQAGNDILFGGGGNDAINGGGGTDRVDFMNAPGAVTARLLAGTATGEGTDTLVSIENAFGSAFGDMITGSLIANEIQGRGGADMLNGAAGDDRLLGGNGNDNLNGASNNDELFGQEGDDTLIGAFGNDLMNGGNGTDTYQIGQPGGAVNVNLSSGVATGAAGSDTLVSVENIIGSNGTDTYTGSAGANRITAANGNDTINGAGGNDELFGQNGNDILNGQSGNDTLNGGAGNDIFIFQNGTGDDTVIGFTGGAGASDRIDVSGFIGITGFADLMANHAAQVGPHVVITLDADDSATLNNVALGSLAMDDFIF